jgi:hypothetical protein
MPLGLGPVWEAIGCFVLAHQNRGASAEWMNYGRV